MGSDLVSYQAQEVRLVVGRGCVVLGLGEERGVSPSPSWGSPRKVVVQEAVKRALDQLG